MPEPLLERAKGWVIMVDELVEKERGVVWRQNSPVSTSDRGIRFRGAH